jgi:hypothetical protein
LNPVTKFAHWKPLICTIDEIFFLAYEGYPSCLFNIAVDSQELINLVNTEPDRLKEMENHLANQVDREENWRIWEEYRRHTFAQFQRQAKRGLYLVNSYSLQAKPSFDDQDIMNNAFTGWDEEEEARINQWLKNTKAFTGRMEIA